MLKMRKFWQKSNGDSFAQLNRSLLKDRLLRTTTEANGNALLQIQPAHELIGKKHLSNDENWDLCSGCTQCCEYVSTEIDKPTDQTTIDNIVWYLIHKDVWVWVDYDKNWYVQFNTRCEKLEDDGRCNWYDYRPKLCQDYKQSECPRYTGYPGEKVLFKNEVEFFSWMENHKSKKKRKLLRQYFAGRTVRWMKPKKKNKIKELQP